MSIFGWGDQTKAAGEGVAAVGGVIDSLFTSDEERLDKQTMMMRVEQAPKMMMSQISLKEAGHRSLFVAGWRPFIGWTAGLSLAFYFIPQYIMGAYIFVNSYINTGNIIEYPVKPDAALELVIALLGLGALRTFEKLNNVSR